uniref:Uncharacterized protein n=1 Tax=Tetraselmis sp. GSL018 TaxID=582737 RepID=A0A061S085_9CHLO
MADPPLDGSPALSRERQPGQALSSELADLCGIQHIKVQVGQRRSRADQNEG